MAKYRIVARDGKCFAQRKYLGFLWLDLPWVSLSGYGQWPAGGENPSRQLPLVENYVEMYRDGVSKTKVVREYD
jgi:hypothetical protein